MVRFFRETCRGYGTNVAFGVVLKGVLGVLPLPLEPPPPRVTLDANYMTLVMNVLCLEGMAQALLPSYNVLDMAPLLDAHKLLPRRFSASPSPPSSRSSDSATARSSGSTELRADARYLCGVRGA